MSLLQIEIISESTHPCERHFNLEQKHQHCFTQSKAPKTKHDIQRDSRDLNQSGGWTDRIKQNQCSYWSSQKISHNVQLHQKTDTTFATVEVSPQHNYTSA